jgi:hypothetical protein
MTASSITYLSSITYFWLALLGSIPLLAIVLTALGLMLGLVKPADIPKKLGTILGILIALMILPSILASAWASMSLWHQIALAAVGVVILLVILPTTKTRGRRKD